MLVADQSTKGSFQTDRIPFVSEGIPGLDIPGIFQLGPTFTVNGQADRFSPGARIRDLNNMLVLSGTLAGKSVYTVYKRDTSGLVHEVWLLTPDEYRKVGGLNVDNPNGAARFVELLALIFAARAAK